jgi:hypothetical protein
LEREERVEKAVVRIHTQSVPERYIMASRVNCTGSL